MRFGIVGTNFVSDDFMKGISFVEEAEVTSVCSRKKENALHFAKKYGICHVFDDYIEMIESGKVDAVYLATPNSAHHQMAMNCLKRKVPVFCEKPMAGNYQQVKEMIDCAKENNTYLHDGTVPLYSPNLEIIKKYIPKIGKIRKVIMMFGKYSSRYDAYLRKENPTTFQRELYNGSLMDIGIYVLADTIALFGKPKETFATASLLDTGVDCLGTMVLKYEDFDAVLMHSKVTNTDIISEIQGEEGNIYIKGASTIDKVFYKPRKHNPALQYNDEGYIQISVEQKHHFANEIEDFIKNVKTGRIESSRNPFELVLDIHQVLTECRLKSGVKFDCD